MLGLQFSVFTSFELLRENEQGGGDVKFPLPRLGLINVFIKNNYN